MRTTLKEINDLYVDDFFHVMFEIFTNDYSDIHLGAAWHETFSRLNFEEAGTPISRKDKKILMAPLKTASDETLQDLLSLFA